ncbi:amino acid transporter [Rubellimicrobium roseum]|uniref:Amino acid transporter n=1 Tax=Rubellimicrobium roseum TaxID=687525 RepID=A0A5C4NG55_9RHOB|nr:amino acid transporter [Rubellimicrobium roseum]TNC71429.1 amino acid transporter [Rubellimicrobium roseum]
MSLVRNEQSKLTANYLNGVAIALMAVGGVAPLIAAFYGDRGATPLLFVAVAICILASAVLHFVARQILRGLTP